MQQISHRSALGRRVDIGRPYAVETAGLVAGCGDQFVDVGAVAVVVEQHGDAGRRADVRGEVCTQHHLAAGRHGDSGTGARRYGRGGGAVVADGDGEQGRGPRVDALDAQVQGRALQGLADAQHVDGRCHRLRAVAGRCRGEGTDRVERGAAAVAAGRRVLQGALIAPGGRRADGQTRQNFAGVGQCAELDCAVPVGPHQAVQSLRPDLRRDGAAQRRCSDIGRAKQ